jgi:thioredoxin reductase
MQDVDVVVIGGGPAGLAAALSAHAEGLEKIIVLERKSEPGGILPQCIHNGFGLERFKEDLTGPEYGRRYLDMIDNTSIEIRLDTMVLGLSADKIITAVNPKQGLFKLQARAVVLAMGCRERTRSAIGISGTRPSGIFTAGTAQRLINIHGYMPGRKAVVLGSGDVGLIMARRMALEGAEVLAVLEIRPYLTGLLRNKVQCLDDFKIPLKLRHTITKIHGKRRLEGVTISRVTEDGKVIAGTEEVIECDTLLTSVGLIPENELSAQGGVNLDNNTNGPVVDQYLHASAPGFFPCGNVLLVNDLVDDVSKQGELAGKNAALFAKGKLDYNGGSEIKFALGNNVHSIVPQKISIPKSGSSPEPIELYIRVKQPDHDRELRVQLNNELVLKKNLSRTGPGEMVKAKLKLKESQLDGLQKDKNELKVEIVVKGE